MNPRVPTIAAGLATALAASAAPFQNLGFEEANLPTLPPNESGGQVPIDRALPGWQAFVGDQPLAFVWHNDLTFGQAAVSLFGPEWPVRPIEGNFDILLRPGASPFRDESVSVSLVQRGTVPLDAQALLFKSDPFFGGGPLPTDPAYFFGVFLDGERLAANQVASTDSYSLFVVDVAGYQGREVELRVTAFHLGMYPNYLSLDSFEFSPVPEPGPWALLGLGGLAWLVSKVRSRPASTVGLVRRSEGDRPRFPSFPLRAGGSAFPPWPALRPGPPPARGGAP